MTITIRENHTPSTVIYTKNVQYRINHYRIAEAVRKNRIKLVEILIALGDDC